VEIVVVVGRETPSRQIRQAGGANSPLTSKRIFEFMKKVDGGCGSTFSRGGAGA